MSDERKREPRSIATWVVTSAVAVLAVHGGFLMAAAREHVGSLLTDLGAELPLPSRVALAAPPQAYVAFGIVVGVCLFVKDAFIERDARRGRANVACCVVLFACF